MIKALVKKILPSNIVKKLRDIEIYIKDGYANKSYSQEGEDMVLKCLLANQSSGFYVDVGAHHPKRFSNTFYFYKKGWRGINIDPRPDCMKLFRRIRPNDINLEIGVASQTGKLEYFMFDEPAYNSFDKSLSLYRVENLNIKLLDKKEISVMPLKDVLDKYLPQNTEIDFMSIDVEGLDLDVLKSNAWDKYRPKFLLVESLQSKMESIGECPVYMYLKSINYIIYAKTGNTNIYLDELKIW